jgi:glutamine amidotransferase
MSKSAAIVDYGTGNILSVRRALEHVGAMVTLARDTADIERADYLVLPGVGAFRDGMQGLARQGAAEAVVAHAAAGKPLLGICLGAQMLMSTSEEFGTHAGLDIIPGKVVQIPATGADGLLHKLPYIGWADIAEARPGSFAGTPLATLGAGNACYLVHSFHIKPARDEDCIAVYHYDGVAVTAAIQHNNVIGMQFHPEKSGPLGLEILRSFLGS